MPSTDGEPLAKGRNLTNNEKDNETYDSHGTHRRHPYCTGAEYNL